MLGIGGLHFNSVFSSFAVLHTDVQYHFFLFDDSGIQTEVQYSALPRGIPCHLFNNGVTDKRSIFILRTKSKLKKISLSYFSRSCTSTFISLFSITSFVSIFFTSFRIQSYALHYYIRKENVKLLKNQKNSLYFHNLYYQVMLLAIKNTSARFFYQTVNQVIHLCIMKLKLFLIYQWTITLFIWKGWKNRYYGWGYRGIKIWYGRCKGCCYNAFQ